MDGNPKPRFETPNYSSYQPEQEMLKLRKRLIDLMNLGAITPDTFQQAVLQIWQETEKRRQACLQEAEEYLRKHHALVAQSYAFASVSSYAYAVIDGFVGLEERRIRELDERAREKAQAEADNLEASKAVTQKVEESTTSKKQKK